MTSLRELGGSPIRVPPAWLPALAAALLAASIAAALWLSVQAQSRFDLVQHTVQVRYGLSELLSGLQDAETGQRGYIITGEEKYLGPHDSAWKALPGQIDTLSGLIEDNPAQVAAVRELRPLIDRRLQRLREGIALRRAGDEAGARQRIQSGEGKALMDQIRAAIARMSAVEEQLYQQREAAAQRTRVALLIALIGAGLVALAAMTVWVRGTRRYVAAIRAGQDERNRIFEMSRDIIVVASQDGRFLRVNPALCDILGWSEVELVASPFVNFVHPDDVGATMTEHGAVTQGVPANRFENRYRTRDGNYRTISWNAVYEQERVYASGRDVTFEREQAARLARTEDQLRQSQKMDAVGQLTGGIAHDFNNMLAIVIGSLSLAGRRLAATPPNMVAIRKYLDAARDGAQRAAILTNRLLAFSRQQALDPEVLDANKLVGGMSELLGRVLGETVRIETVFAAGLWPICADRSQLEAALVNLAVNARDAMAPEGGRLTVETANCHLDDRYVQEHPGVPAGQYVLIAVTDTGTGMTPETASRVFEPFFTTKGIGKGTGLGLSMVHGFINQSGGYVRLYSEPGEGTTVKLYLPRRFGAGEPRILFPVPAEELPLGRAGEVILVVEDEERVRRYSVDALRELGYTVIHAYDAATAMEKLESHPDVTLLFTDIVMPGQNGSKLAGNALRARPELKVLFTTGYTRNAVVHNNVLDPGVQLLTKPFTLEQLARKVRAILDGPAL